MFTDGQLIALALVFQGVLMACIHAWHGNLLRQSTENHKNYYDYLKLRDARDREDKYQYSRLFKQVEDTEKEKNA